MGKSTYLSPEAYAGLAHDGRARDVWAAGVCLYAMLTSRPLCQECPCPARDTRFSRFVSRGGVRALAREDGCVLPAAALSLLDDMLALDPARRPTAAALLRDPRVALACDGGCEDAAWGATPAGAHA